MQKGEETGLVRANPTVALRHCNSKSISNFFFRTAMTEAISNKCAHTQAEIQTASIKGTLIPRTMKTS